MPTRHTITDDTGTPLVPPVFTPEMARQCFTLILLGIALSLPALWMGWTAITCWRATDCAAVPLNDAVGAGAEIAGILLMLAVACWVRGGAYVLLAITA